jgi:hypothetical protein
MALDNRNRRPIHLADFGLVVVNATPDGKVRLYAEDDSGEQAVVRFTIAEVTEFIAALTEAAKDAVA